MTDRVLFYDNEILQASDLLKIGKFAMLGDAFLSMATLGDSSTAPSTVVAGLPCKPTSPASLQVNVGPGAIFSLDATDAIADGDLGTDATQIFKMGTRPNTGTLTITPPSTSGYSQVFLVQAILSDIDGGNTVLNYYNADNPEVPYSGPNNDRTSQNTTRTCVCTVALKAGVAANTGTQTNPAPDAGYIALYYITVANGQTQIVSSNIAAVNGGFAPFVNTALPYIPSAVQAGGWVSGIDTGAANAAVVTLAPVPASLSTSMEIRVKMAAAPLGSSTLTVNTTAGNVTKSIVTSGAAAIAANAWQAGDIVPLVYDGTNWQARGVVVAGAPVYLQAPKTLYVGGTGASDSNDGLSATVSGGHGPFATIQKAVDQVPKYNLNGFTLTIRVAHGSYSGITLAVVNGSGLVAIIGDDTAPGSVTIAGVNQSAIVGNYASGRYTVSGFTLTASGSSPTDTCCCFVGAGFGTTVLFGVINWGSNIGGMIAGSQGIVLGNTVSGCAWAIVGNSAGTSADGSFIFVTSGAIFQSQNTGGPSLSCPNPQALGGGNGAFITAQVLAFAQLTYSGGASGNLNCKQYNVSTSSIISSNGGGSGYYPGSPGTGSVSTGGQYI